MFWRGTAASSGRQMTKNATDLKDNGAKLKSWRRKNSLYSCSDYKQNVCCLDWAKLYICWGSSTSCEGPTTNIKQTVVDVSPKLCLKHVDLKRLDVLWVWSAEMYLTNICHKFAKFSFETKKVGTGAPIEQNDICIEGRALFHREGRMHTTNIHINSTRKSICHLSLRFWSPYFIWQHRVQNLQR